MQREETTAAIGPYHIRLFQRPRQVPPTRHTFTHDADPTADTVDSHSCPRPPLDDAGAPPPPPPPLPLPPPAPAPQGAGAPDAGTDIVFSPPGLQLSDCLLGWELWPAAWRLATYLASPPGAALVRAAVAIVELGAGLGLPGLVAAKAGARSVTLTDLPQALPLLEANVELNGVAGVCRTAVLDWAHLARGGGGAATLSSRGCGNSGGGGCAAACPAGRQERVEEEVKVEEEVALATGLEEGMADGCRPVAGCDGAQQHAGMYDVVLAADVVYVSSLVPLLTDTIAAVCRRRRRDRTRQHGDGNGGGGGGAVVLVGHAVRKSVWFDKATGRVRTDDTDEPWEAFVDRMTRVHGFTCVRLRDHEGSAEAETLGDSADGAAVTWGPPDTFIYAFTAPLQASAQGSGA